MADSVASFLDEVQPPIPEDEKLHLGLTFSFPVEQTALDSGILLTWTKGFAAKNAIGHDVVGLLQSAFDRRGVCVKCVALVNDVCSSLSNYNYRCSTHVHSTLIVDSRRASVSSIYVWRMYTWCALYVNAAFDRQLSLHMQVRSSVPEQTERMSKTSRTLSNSRAPLRPHWVERWS